MGLRPKPRVPHLRDWQREALEQFSAAGQRTWLTTATPGAGKTTYALAAAGMLWRNGFIDRLIVVAPTDHLRTQWVAAATERGFDLRSTPNNERLPDDAEGCVVTYAQVAAAPGLHQARIAHQRRSVSADTSPSIADLQWSGQPIPDHLRPTRTSTPVGDDPSDLRRRIAKAVGAYAASRKISHGAAWQELYAKVPGPKNSEATIALLQQRWATIRRLLDTT